MRGAMSNNRCDITYFDFRWNCYLISLYVVIAVVCRLCSQVDLTSLQSIAAHPLVSSAQYSEVMLGPGEGLLRRHAGLALVSDMGVFTLVIVVLYFVPTGETLFIPRWTWHLVMSVDRESAARWRLSQSVNGLCKGNESKETLLTPSVAKGGGEVDYSISVSCWWGRRICAAG